VAGSVLWLLGSAYWASAVILVLLSGATHGMQGLINSLAMDYVNAGRKLDFGLARGIGSGGYAVASAVLGALTARLGPGVLPMAHTLLYGCMTVLLLTMPYAPGVPEHEEAEKHSGFFRRYPAFSACLLGCVCLFFGYNVASTFMFQIVSARGGTSAAMGGVLSLGAFLELPAMAVFSLLLRRWSASGLLRVSAVFLTAKATVLLCTTGLSGVWAAQLLQPLAYALVIPAGVYYTNRILAPSDRVLGQALMAATSTLASVFGSALGGMLLDAMGVAALLTVAVVVSVVGAAIVLFSARSDYFEPQ
jgi:PPP family 3-phenylpropionic acid transporter